MITSNFNIIFLILIGLIQISCNEEFIPKPRGYYRIDLPKPTYQIYQDDCPFKFEHQKSATINNDRSRLAEQCWLNIIYPKYKATIHLSYKPVNNNIEKYLNDSYTLVYKHTVKAADISEKLVLNPNKKVYGVIYQIEGEAASACQFHLTDSINHFVRGALYFNVAPNQDSLAPVIAYIQNDIEHFVNSFEWK